jgi:adenylate kinase family enzyme
VRGQEGLQERAARYPPRMRRVHVVGTSGSGKSTVAAALARRLGVPHVELDALHWLPGWQERPVAEFRAHLSAALVQSGWVVDGNYAAQSRDLVWAAVDTVVWLDLPRRTVMRQVVQRTARRWLRREQLWGGNRESLRKTLLSRDSVVWWAWSTHARRRTEYGQALRSVPFRVIHLRSRAEVDQWLATVSPPASAS